VGKSIGGDTRRDVAESGSEPVYRQQKSDFRRAQAHACGDRGRDQPDGAGSPVIGEVADKGRCQQESLFLLFPLPIHQMLSPSNSHQVFNSNLR